MQVSKFWLGHLDLNQKVHIFGGGISGLIAAYHFKKSGVDFILHESSNRLGGKLQTDQTEYGLVEWAANAIVNSPLIEQLFIELEMSPIAAATGLKRCIYRNGKIRSFPAINFFEGVKVFKNLFRSIPLLEKTSLKDAFLPLLGNQLCDEILTPIFRGIYATGSENLIATSVIPDFSEFEGMSYHYFITNKLKNKSPLKSMSFMGGMQELVDRLSYEVKDFCELNSQSKIEVNSLICTDPRNAALLVESLDLELSSILKEIESVDIHSTTCFFEKEIQELKNCFGLLFNESESPNIMGILVNHEIFPQRNYPHFSYTIISKNDSFQVDDIPIIKKYSTNLLKSYSSGHKYGLPLYNSKLTELRNQLDKNSKVAFWGNYTDSISLRKIVEATL